MTLEKLIALANYDLRSISFHTDGRVIAKTGGGAKFPKKLYTGKSASEALLKLIKDNKMEDLKDEELIDWQDTRENWAAEYNRLPKDIIMDEETGKEYIMADNASDDKEFTKLELPENLQDKRKPF